MRLTDRQRLREVQVPDGIADEICSGAYDRQREGLRRARSAWDRHELLIVLSGPTQSGKSTIAAALLADAYRPGRWVRVALPAEPSDPDSYQAFNGAYYVTQSVEVGVRPYTGAWIHAPRAHEQLFSDEFWRSASGVGALVLDDLGLEPQNQQVRDRLIGMLVDRANQGRPTVITTNLDPEQFRVAYCFDAGERLAARIRTGWVQVGPAQAFLAIT